LLEYFWVLDGEDKREEGLNKQGSLIQDWRWWSLGMFLKVVLMASVVSHDGFEHLNISILSQLHGVYLLKTSKRLGCYNSPKSQYAKLDRSVAVNKYIHSIVLAFFLASQYPMFLHLLYISFLDTLEMLSLFYFI